MDAFAAERSYGTNILLINVWSIRVDFVVGVAYVWFRERLQYVGCECDPPNRGEREIHHCNILARFVGRVRVEWCLCQST